MTSALRFSVPSLSILGMLAVIVGVSTLELGFLLPFALLGVWFVVWSFSRPEVAVATIVLLYLNLIDQSEGITPVEIAIGLYTYGFLGYWFLSKFFLRRGPLLTRAPDFFLTAFLALCALSVVLLLAANSRIDYWFREGVTIAALLLYFPTREAMRKRRGLALIVGSFVVLAVTVAVVNIHQYRASTLAANYLWEIWGGRKPWGTALYMGLAVGAISAFVHMQGAARRTLALLIAAVAVIALGTTFYRGFWIGTLLGCLVLFVLIPLRARVRLFWVGLLGTVVVTLVVIVVAGDLADAVFRGVTARFVSSGTALEDVSVTNRIAETKTVLRLVPQSPLVGHGYGAWYHHFNIITQMTEAGHYVHNVYVYLLMKVGVIGLFLFGGYFLSVVAAGVQISRRAEQSPFVLAMVRASVACFVGFLFVGTTSGVLEDKQVLLIIVLGTAIITSCREG